MDTLIVGEEPCTIAKVAEIMGQSSVLQINWSTLARRLGVPEIDIEAWRNDLRLHQITFEDLVVRLVTNWKGRCADDAKFDVLCKTLTDCNAKDIADKLEHEFAEIVKADILTNGEVSVNDRVIKVSDIFKTTADLPPGTTKIFRNNEPIQILTNFQIPNRPKYYIQRTVSPRTRLNTNVFKSVSSDVFVLENLDWSTLDDTLFGSNLERSSTQTVRVTAKFILLDFKKDYEQICKVAPSNTPVHLVRFDSGSYYWVRSRGSLKLIQQYASQEQTHLSEEQFVVNHLSKFQNTPVCFADTPGMGKSLLLASIAQRVQETHAERVVLFLVLRELGQSTNSQGVDLLCKQITNSDFSGKVLERLIEMNELQFELFLDGFDEVLPIQIDYVNRLLLRLKQNKNIRLHATTRPHMRNQLEETLGVLGYNILPFTKDNQVNFLTRFWKNCEDSRGEELDDSRLGSFAKQCLEMLKTNMNKVERDIAGIPLQCALLAEVYAYDAVKYSMKQSNSEFELTCKVESIFHMFQQLIKKKMERVQSLSDFEKQELLVAHVCEALELIFPDKDTCLLKIGNRDLLTHLYAVGLMEPSTNDAGANPKFVHRTFAEFFIAEHLVKHLQCTPCSRFLVDAVLGELTPDSKNVFKFVSYYYYKKDFLEVKSFQFSQKIITYFLNAHLDAAGSDFPTASWIINEPVQDMDKMLSACCLNNYVSIFKGLAKVVLSGQVDSKAWAWRDMAVVAARYSEPNLMEQLVQLMQRMGKLLSELNFINQHNCFPVTPLHVAVQRGSYIMTRYLVNQLYPCLESLPYLLHSCVYQSANNSDAIVKEKILIIRLLIGVRKDVVHVRLARSNSTPLLLPNVHVDLMCTLIQNGADVNAVDSNNDTVLHIIIKHDWKFHRITPGGYTQLLNLLRASNFNLWDEKGKDDETPLYVAVKSIEVEHSVLDQYFHLNVDFNLVIQSPYYFGEHSVLFAAFIGNRSASFITKLEQLGANVNYINSRGESALHIAARYGNYDVARYLVTDRNLNVNHRDCYRQPPLHFALPYDSPNHFEIQSLFIDNEAELEDPEYKWRPTSLYLALSNGSAVSLDIVKKMVDKGLGSEHLALALDPLVRKKYIKAAVKRNWFINMFRYLYQHGGRIQDAVKKLEQHKWEFERAIVYNDQLLEQLKVATGNEVVLNGIHSAADLCGRVIAGDIGLEQFILALLECNQSEAVEAIRELLQYKKHQKFRHTLPEVHEFICCGNQMIVVAAPDLQICAEKVLDTIGGVVVVYQEGIELLPGTLCLVKLAQQQLNFPEYLDGLEELPYRFIVVCEKSLAAELEEHTYTVLRHSIKWDDLTRQYQDELRQKECIGFQLSQKAKWEFFEILRDESLAELMRNGHVSTDHLGKIIQSLVDELDEQQVRVLEKHSFYRFFPPYLAEIMRHECCDYKSKARKLIQNMKWTTYDENCVCLFIAARAVLNTRFSDQLQMEQVFAYVFECEQYQHTNHDKEDGDVTFLTGKCYRFKHELLVYFTDWLTGRGYKFQFNFQPDWLDHYTNACLNTNAVNLLGAARADRPSHKF